MYYMFSGCTSLEYLDISYFGNDHLTEDWRLSGIFTDLDSLKYINLFGINENTFQKSIFKSLSGIQNLIICKIEGDIGIDNTINICNESYYSYPAINYVTITYNESKYGEKELNKNIDGYFTIGLNNTLEIHFTSLLEKFDNFFSCSSTISSFDKKGIIEFDFSHFNSSKITNMNSMFLDCASIEYINFTNFKTSSVTDMSKMFKGCTNLKSLNLTSFDTSLVTDMSDMFSDCNSLKYLYIYNFNTENLKTVTNMFSNNLQYIDISNMTKNKVIKDEFSSLNSNKDLLICQINDIIQDVNTACCDIDSDENKICNTNNYIIVQYGKQTEYNNGFGNENRDGVVFIIYNDTLYLKNESLTIEENGIIEIHFGYTIKSLNAFFGYGSNSDSGDKNVVNIVSVDLSFFNSSLINDINSMFQGCNSLKEINFTNFNTSSVINMKKLFEDCSNLEYLDLSGFRTLNVKDMSYMFSNCKSLKFLDISNFYINNIVNIDMLFNELNSLETINLFNVENGKLLDTQIEKLKNGLNVCQKENIISEDKATNLCKNYIKTCFRENVIYENGFNYNEENEINQYRNNVILSFIEYESFNLSKNPLDIKSSSCIIITLNSSVESLAHFFNSKYDKNVENIISVDFSYFYSSSLNDINSLFKGCKSLENVTFTNFNTSLVTNMSEDFLDVKD